MKLKTLMLVPAATLAMTVGVAHADDGLALGRVDQVLDHATSYGFTHFEEIEAKSRDSVEVEGWLDDEWYADVRLSMADGESLKEERQRMITGAWGMTADDVRQAFDAASTEGVVDFEEIKVKKDGSIEIEGRNDQGRELEITTRLGESGVTHVERD